MNISLSLSRGELAKTSIPVDPNEQTTLWLQARHVQSSKSQNLKSTELWIFQYTNVTLQHFKAITIVKTLRL